MKIDMSNVFIIDMLKTSGMVNYEQCINIYHLFIQVLLQNVPGDVAEFGCHRGKTAKILQKVIDVTGSDKKLYLYDSFEGLPKKNIKDGTTPFKTGQMSANQVPQLDLGLVMDLTKNISGSFLSKMD